MTTPTTFKTIPVRVAMTPETKCGYCTNSKCCTYITQQVDTPRSMLDFDQLLWQVSHQNVQAYKDEDGWFLLVNNTCSHLQSGGRCGIYDVRPDGIVSLPLIVEMRADGLTVMELTQLIKGKLAAVMEDPEVNIQVARINSKKDQRGSGGVARLHAVQR